MYAATVGAGSELARSAQTFGSDLSVALKRAYAERRPVVLAVSKDLQWLEVDPPLPPQEQHAPSPETWRGWWRICGEVLLGVIAPGSDSYLSVDPDWRPTLPGREGGFKLIDLLLPA
jgi:hypothetical protein